MQDINPNTVDIRVSGKEFTLTEMFGEDMELFMKLTSTIALSTVGALRDAGRPTNVKKVADAIRDAAKSDTDEAVMALAMVACSPEAITEDMLKEAYEKGSLRASRAHDDKLRWILFGLRPIKKGAQYLVDGPEGKQSSERKAADAFLAGLTYSQKKAIVEAQDTANCLGEILGNALRPLASR